MTYQTTFFPEDMMAVNTFGYQISQNILSKWKEKLNLSDERLEKELLDLKNQGVSIINTSDLAIGFSETEYVFYKGNYNLLKRPSVAIVGTRNPSENGQMITKKIIDICKNLNFVIVSGLAKGIDTYANSGALKVNAETIGVLGTPINHIYPATNLKLANEVAQKGLLLSLSMPFERRGQYLFPRRNRFMASITDATVIVEAGETSGVIHQAAECLRKNKKLFILQNILNNSEVTWAKNFIKSGAIAISSEKELFVELSKCK
jgi:DNA processing protein